METENKNFEQDSPLTESVKYFEQNKGKQTDFDPNYKNAQCSETVKRLRTQEGQESKDNAVVLTEPDTNSADETGLTADSIEKSAAAFEDTAESTHKDTNESEETVNGNASKSKGLKPKKTKRRNRILKREYRDIEETDPITKGNVEEISNNSNTAIQKLCDNAESSDGLEHDNTDIDKFNEEDESKKDMFSRLRPGFTSKAEYRTALQVDTSYQAGVSSDSNCSQYSASSWTSEHDTSSSLDPSPNLWNSCIDSGVSLGTSAVYSDTSDISGEDGSMCDVTNIPRYPPGFRRPNDLKLLPDQYHFPRNKLCYTSVYPNGAVHTNGAYPNLNVYSEYDYSECYGGYSETDYVSETGDSNCEYCSMCACSSYKGCSLEAMQPGDVFYFAANSVVVCVKRQHPYMDSSAFSKKWKVTPKSAALNPNASVFLSSLKSSTPAGVTDNGQWEANDSGIGNTTSSVSDYSYANGDISGDKSDVGVFSPGTEAPFQPEFTQYSETPNFNGNSSVVMKLEENMGSLVVDGNGGGGYGVDVSVPPSGYVGDGVPMTGIQYPSENGSATEGETTEVTGDEKLRQVLKNQLESFFTRENLANDSYLQSQMDADQYVPIATVANLEQIQRLTDDQTLIVELLRESAFVQVDEKGEKVRPNHNRCIVILREIPDSTPVEEVQALFSGQNCPKFVNCEFAHNSSWYVTFDSDADAQRAYQYLREEVRTFQGKPIMARIKAKPLIRRTYPPRNGFIERQFQPSVAPSIPTEVVSSSAPQPQFTATQPFTLMPNVSQYLNGQQAIPFYPPPPPPPSQLLQTWPNPTMLDPSMVLAMNGYQATNVNVKVPQTNNRNLYNQNMNRGNINNRNQKPHGNSGPPPGRDRINSNDSLPPRLQHVQQERQMNAQNSMHKTSQPISNHAQVYQGRRGDGPGHGSHSNHHSHHGNSGHPMHSGPMSHSHSYHPQQQLMPHHQGMPPHLDGNRNISNGLPGHRNSQSDDPQRYAAGKSYKSRRRREEDGARPNRSNPSQPSQRDGQPVVPAKPLHIDKFDYEPTSFPPLPGSGNNSSSGDVFESKLSDVVKGTAKPQVKDVPKPVSSMSTISTATTTVTTSKPLLSKDVETTSASGTSSQSTAGTTSSQSTAGARVASSGTTAAQQPTVSQPVRSSSKTVQSVPDSKAGDKEKTSQSQSNTEDPNASLSASSVKLSYAQMVQKTKVAEVSANSLHDDSEESETEDQDTSAPASRALKEQGQQQAPSSSKSLHRGSGKDFSRKDSRENDSDARREDRDRDFRKENEYRRDEPREQRVNRRMKENRGEPRERRFNDRDRDRDFSRRNDRRDRDGPPPVPKDRDGPRQTAAATTAAK